MNCCSASVFQNWHCSISLFSWRSKKTSLTNFPKVKAYCLKFFFNWDMTQFIVICNNQRIHSGAKFCLSQSTYFSHRQPGDEKASSVIFQSSSFLSPLENNLALSTFSKQQTVFFLVCISLRVFACFPFESLFCCFSRRKRCNFSWIKVTDRREMASLWKYACSWIIFFYSKILTVV